MRFSAALAVFVSTLSMAAFAGSPREESNPIGGYIKTKAIKANGEVAAPSMAVSSSTPQSAAARPEKRSGSGPGNVSLDNVQGLSPTDRRYRYYD